LFFSVDYVLLLPTINDKRFTTTITNHDFTKPIFFFFFSFFFSFFFFSFNGITTTITIYEDRINDGVFFCFLIICLPLRVSFLYIHYLTRDSIWSRPDHIIYAVIIITYFPLFF